MSSFHQTIRAIIIIPNVLQVLNGMYAQYDPRMTMDVFKTNDVPVAKLLSYCAIMVNGYVAQAAYNNNRSFFRFTVLLRAVLAYLMLDWGERFEMVFWWEVFMAVFSALMLV